MRSLIVTLSLMLILAACSPAASTQTGPAADPVEPTVEPAENMPATPDPPVKTTLENSILATEWRGDPEGSLLFPMDPLSGTALPAYEPIPLGDTFFHAFSPDRHTLAIVSFPDQIAYNGSLLLVDLPAWKTRRFELGLVGWVNAMVFSPDGRQLAISHGQTSQTLSLVDVEQGTVTAQRGTDSSMASRLKFTRDGKALMFYGPVIKNRFTENEMSAGPPRILLVDAADLNPLWSAEPVDVRDGIFPADGEATPENIHEPGQAYYLTPGLVFAPDQDVLYIVHADSAKLTTVDFERQAIDSVDIGTKRTWLENLLSLTARVARAKVGDGTTRQAAISPDGQFLYVVGMNSVTYKDSFDNWKMEQSPHGLEIVQASDGSQVARFESDATELSLSPDGRFLYLRSWNRDEPWTSVFDTASMQFGPGQKWVFATPALRLDGRYVLTSVFSTSEYTHHIKILDPDRLEVLAAWTDTNLVWWLTP